MTDAKLNRNIIPVLLFIWLYPLIDSVALLCFFPLCIPIVFLFFCLSIQYSLHTIVVCCYCFFCFFFGFQFNSAQWKPNIWKNVVRINWNIFFVFYFMAFYDIHNSIEISSLYLSFFSIYFISFAVLFAMVIVIPFEVKHLKWINVSGSRYFAHLPNKIIDITKKAKQTINTQ